MNEVWFITLCFFSISLILLLISRLLLSLKHSKHPKYYPSTKHLIGSQGIVTKKIGRTYLETGLIQLDHEIWPAISYSGHPIPLGQLVEIKDIKGVHAIVSLKSKKGG